MSGGSRWGGGGGERGWLKRDKVDPRVGTRGRDGEKESWSRELCRQVWARPGQV